MAYLVLKKLIYLVFLFFFNQLIFKYLKDLLIKLTSFIYIYIYIYIFATIMIKLRVAPNLGHATRVILWNSSRINCNK